MIISQVEDVVQDSLFTFSQDFFKSAKSGKVESKETGVGVLSDEGGDSNDGADVTHVLDKISLGSTSSNENSAIQIVLGLDDEFLFIENVFALEDFIEARADAVGNLERSLGLGINDINFTLMEN